MPATYLAHSTWDGCRLMSIDVTAVPRRCQVESFDSDGETLVYSAARDEASTLNRTATEIWSLCDGVRSVHAIAGALAGRYGVNAATLLPDVTSACALLAAKGLIEFERGDPDAGTA